ncbi:MFS transporter [Erysipelothrix enhydrae]|uniref:MFS transporter n=1 Tax=Erysipelothrix enhydrae TaxID=2890314 RepID=UPI002B245E36|nr:MFS transporter [Erysipelothrix sp. 4322-04]WRB87649.1 MFS transporter [Erysipelothrix sp. 4322-04]
MHEPLWNQNFIRVFLGTIFSEMGGIGLNLALSLIIFDQTQSTLLSGIFAALSMIPNLMLPLVIGPLIDRKNPLKVLITNESILLIVFVFSGLYVYFFPFNYYSYLLIILAISSLGNISAIASQSIIPQIILPENFSRANAILNTIHPLCSVIVTPIAIMLYRYFGLAFIFFAYSLLTLIDVLIEYTINTEFDYIRSDNTTLSDLFNDLYGGLLYLKSDRALRSVFMFFALVIFSSASSTLMYPFFMSSASLNETHFATLQSLASLGYLIGGLIHSILIFKDNHRYAIAVSVYILFITLESIFYFVSFPFMVLIRMTLGVLGMNSANIRISSVQKHVPAQYRAKVNSFFIILVSGAGMVGQVVFGALAEYFPIPQVHLFAQVFYLLALIAFILPRKNKVKEFYNYRTI